MQIVKYTVLNSHGLIVSWEDIVILSERINIVADKESQWKYNVSCKIWSAVFPYILII